MQDSGSLHLQVQEHIDCFAQTDPLREMSRLSQEGDTRVAALKWLALAALHGINHNAEAVTITRRDDGRVNVSAVYREAELPTPGSGAGKAVLDLVRAITHIENDKGRTPLALGIRDSSVELQVKIKRGKGREKVTLRFPPA
jgi:hypothetical protein